MTEDVLWIAAELLLFGMLYPHLEALTLSLREK